MDSTIFQSNQDIEHTQGDERKRLPNQHIKRIQVIAPEAITSETSHVFLYRVNKSCHR